MKLTEKEQEICKQYSAKGENGFVHCGECPLVIDEFELECYASIDDGTERVKELKRY